MSEIEILQKVKPKKLIELMCNLPGSKWPSCSLMFTFLTLLAPVVSVALVVHLLVADCLLVQHHLNTCIVQSFVFSNRWKRLLKEQIFI